MSKSVIALVVTTLACGSASAYLWQQLRVEREQTQRLQSRIADLEHAPTAIDATPAPVQTTPPPVPSDAIPATAAVAKAATPPATFAAVTVASPNARNGQLDPNMRRRMQEGFDQQRALLKDPEYRELMRSQQKMSMQRAYGDLEMMLGLSKDEADRVLDVLAEQQLRQMEQQPIMSAMDGSQPDEAMLREQRRAFEETRRKNETEMAAVLGPKYGEWQTYQQNMWSRSQVMRLRETLAGSSDPLRQDQIRPLVQALAREQQQMQMNTVRGQFGVSGPEAQLRMQEEWLERTAQSHERIRTAVSGLLSPSQLEQLQQQQDQERKMQELSLRMQRARAADAQARGEYPTAEVQLESATGRMIVR